MPLKDLGLWWQKPKEQWDASDWLMFAAKQLLDRGELDSVYITAANLVMEVAEQARPAKAVKEA